MAIIVFVLVNLLSLGGSGLKEFLSDPTARAKDFLGAIAFYVGLTLFWGYVCVGIGYGVYKILQRRGVLKEDIPVTPVPLVAPS